MPIKDEWGEEWLTPDEVFWLQWELRLRRLTTTADNRLGPGWAVTGGTDEAP